MISDNLPSHIGLQKYIAGYPNKDTRAWLLNALDSLLNAGSISQQGASFIIDNHVEIRIKPFSWWQQGMGVRWTADGAIEMRADKVSWWHSVKPYQLPGLIHEVKHLEQGKRIALSQLGEVQAWFTEYEAGRELGLRMAHIPPEIVSWGTNPTKDKFVDAGRSIIQQQSRRYLFWLLPRYSFLASYETNLLKLPT